MIDRVLETTLFPLFKSSESLISLRELIDKGEKDSDTLIGKLSDVSQQIRDFNQTLLSDKIFPEDKLKSITNSRAKHIIGEFAREGINSKIFESMLEIFCEMIDNLVRIGSNFDKRFEYIELSGPDKDIDLKNAWIQTKTLVENSFFNAYNYLANTLKADKFLAKSDWKERVAIIIKGLTGEEAGFSRYMGIQKPQETRERVAELLNLAV